LDNIQINAINTWIPMGTAAKYAMVHLPLADNVRAALNQTALLNFIFSNVGYPYGYHNFIMTFFDTVNGNLPWPASWQFIEVVFNFLSALDSALTDQLMGDALNMRLGTVNLTLTQAANMAASKLGMNIAQLIATPEQDTWVYSDGPSMVRIKYYFNHFP
jgi:hypothetical protein